MRKFSKLLALFLLLAMALSIPAQAEATAMIDLFSDPDVDSKGMFRFWLPYAIETYEQIEAPMRELYESGFGGVEVSFFASSSSLIPSACIPWKE